MTDPGVRAFLIVVQRADKVRNGYGEEELIWTDFTSAYARVRYGTSAERREAAQEQGSQVATFECGWTPNLASVRPSDRVSFGNGLWDVTGSVVTGLNQGVEITAVLAT